MRRAVLWVLGVATAVGGLAAANWRRDPTPAEVDWRLFRPSPPSVTVGSPTRGDIARTVAAKGVVEPIREVQVVAKVSGKVVEVRVEEGSLVHVGDVLVQLDPAPFRTRADSAKTRLDTARTNIDKAEAHLRDIEKDPAAATTPATPAVPNPMLGLPGAAAPPPAASGPTRLEVARNSLDGWKRERKAAETADEAARIDLDRSTVRATIDGVVEELAVEVGDDVLAGPSSRPASPAGPSAPPGMMGGLGFGGEVGSRLEVPAGPTRPLCTVLDPDRVRVRAWIDEADVSLVASDQPARIFLPDEPTRPLPGRIVRVAPRGKPTGEVVAYAATIAFDTAGKRPRPGMRVNVEVEVSRKGGLLGVPVQAVLHRKRRDLVRQGTTPGGAPSREADSEYVKAVFVLDGNQVRLRPIETGLSDERRVEVVAGLALDDRIIVGPFRALDSLEDAMVVQVEGESAESLSLTRRPDDPSRRPAR